MQKVKCDQDDVCILFITTETSDSEIRISVCILNSQQSSSKCNFALLRINLNLKLTAITSPCILFNYNFIKIKNEVVKNRSRFSVQSFLLYSNIRQYFLKLILPLFLNLIKISLTITVWHMLVFEDVTKILVLFYVQLFLSSIVRLQILHQVHG